MVHDRRINNNGEAMVFGNQGGLFMNAMTWYDHETDSVWSQVWGKAIAGPLKGAELPLIPAQIVPWATWKAQHPDTLAMLNGKDAVFSRAERVRDGWVAGISLDEHSKAYYFEALVRERVINDEIGPYPVVAYADPETRDVRIFLRQVGEDVLTFELDESGAFLVDQETGTQWDVTRGLAREGSLQGQALREVPYISSFDWAWLDFHPESEFYE